MPAWLRTSPAMVKLLGIWRIYCGRRVWSYLTLWEHPSSKCYGSLIGSTAMFGRYRQIIPHGLRDTRPWQLLTNRFTCFVKCPPRTKGLLEWHQLFAHWTSSSSTFSSRSLWWGSSQWRRFWCFSLCRAWSNMCMRLWTRSIKLAWFL